MDQRALLSALDWQIELGADEAIGDVPLNRYEAPEKLAPIAKTQHEPQKKPAIAEAATTNESSVESAPLEPTAALDPVAIAKAAAAAASDLTALSAAMASYAHCDLRRGARNLVFADGNPAARVMIVGEAPGRDEDLAGLPFVGAAGQLLNRMLAAIGLDRASGDPATSVYITNVLPWRPPRNRDPDPDEIAMLLPFVERHITLAAPDVLILMGDISCQALLGGRGITRLRGQWKNVLGLPAIPMFHPAYLLRNPLAKRESWHDLLTLQAHLEGGE